MVRKIHCSSVFDAGVVATDLVADGGLCSRIEDSVYAHLVPYVGMAMRERMGGEITDG